MLFSRFSIQCCYWINLGDVMLCVKCSSFLFLILLFSSMQLSLLTLFKVSLQHVVRKRYPISVIFSYISRVLSVLYHLIAFTIICTTTFQFAFSYKDTELTKIRYSFPIWITTLLPLHMQITWLRSYWLIRAREI